MSATAPPTPPDPTSPLRTSRPKTLTRHGPSPRAGRLFAITGAVVGVVYGYDLGSISGALVFLGREFHLSAAGRGFVNAVLVLGSLVGALAGGRIADRIGRRPAMAIVAASYTVCVVVSALAPNVVVLDTVRFLLGIAIGICIVAAPLYIAESAPAHRRGACLAAYQVATVAGITVTCFVNWALAGGGHWRLMLGLSAVPAALVLVPILRLPDTPRWYVLKGRNEEAAAVMGGIDPGVDPAAETQRIRAALAGESGGSLRALARAPYRRAAVFVVGLGFFCQITGINAVTYYSPDIFAGMGFTGGGERFLLPALVQLASLTAACLALLVVDRAGRRRVLLGGITAMVVTLAVLSAPVVADPSGHPKGAQAWCGFAAVVLFTAAYNFGFGATIWIYAAEAFPARLRSAGASLMLSADLVANLLVAQFFPALTTSVGPGPTFAVLGVFAGAALVFSLVTAPETRGRRLEEIQEFWQAGGHWPTWSRGPSHAGAPSAASGGRSTGTRP